MIKPALQVISAEYVNRAKSKIMKKEGTLFSGTLKVLENKVYVWLKSPMKKSSVPRQEL